MIGPLGGRERGFLGGGGSSTASTWSKRSVESAAVAATVSELDSDSESNVNPGGEEESRAASGLSGAEWSGAEE